MRISYILQLKDFFVMFGFGAILGAFYGIIKIPNKIKRNIFFQIFSDLIFSLTACALLIILVNIINLGEYRAFLIAGYTLGFIVERITLGKLFAKGYLNVYNKLSKNLKKFTNSKLGKVIFK